MSDMNFFPEGEQCGYDLPSDGQPDNNYHENDSNTFDGFVDPGLHQGYPDMQALPHDGLYDEVPDNGNHTSSFEGKPPTVDNLPLDGELPAEPVAPPRESRSAVMFLDQEKTRPPEVKEARNRVVTAIGTLAEDVQQSEAQTTTDGRAIFQGSVGRTELDRMSDLYGVALVSHEYGMPGLHVGTEDDRPVMRLIEQQDEDVNVFTVIGEDPLQAVVREDEWNPGSKRDRVSHVGYERLIVTETDGLLTVESWDLDLRGDGNASVCAHTHVADPRKGGTADINAGSPEYEKAMGIVDLIRAIAPGQS